MKWYFIPSALLIMSIFLHGCNLGASVDRSFQGTVDSLTIQQTLIAQTSARYTQTALAQQPTAVIQLPEPTQHLTPKVDLIPTITLQVNTDEQPGSVNPTSGSDLERRIKASKILLFENMSGSREIRYAKQALDEAGYFYLDVGSATGWFKNQLLLNEDWDLIIAAAEARRDFGGEYFQYIHDNVMKGTAAVIEFWDIDDAPLGKIKPLLDDCGVKFQADWYDPDLRSVFWLQTEHPILNEPNQFDHKLREALPFWSGDIGDLLQINSSQNPESNEALLLAGTSGKWKDDHGTLAICLGGRLILQTFSSHEFSMQDMVALWQNYIYHALKSHHSLTSEDVYIPASGNELPEIDQTRESDELVEITELGKVGEPIDCGPLIINVPKAPYTVMDMFEHHAQGEYLIIDIEIVNKLNQSVQIWDDDYLVGGTVNGEQVQYSPDRAASGYLYIENPVNLSQDQIDPGGSWSTTLAFDVDPLGENWWISIKPGAEAGLPVCDVRILLNY